MSKAEKEFKAICRDKQRGYKEAAEIDEGIAELLVEYPLCDHPEFWRTFLRTVNSTLLILEGTIGEYQN